MPLLLVTGRANAGKTGAAHDAVRVAAREGRQPVLLLPSDPDVDRARRELSREVPLGLRVSTFARHVKTTWAAFGDGRTVVTPGQRQLLLSQIAESGAGRHGSPGLGTLASQAIDLLADGTGIAWRSGEPSIAGPAGDLHEWIEQYALQLEQQELVELGEAYHLLSERSVFGGDPLVVHRFTDFTTAQEHLLTAAARDIEVVVTLPWEKGFPPTTALDPLVERLSRLGDVVSCAEDPRETDEELLRLGAELFGSPEPQPPRGAVRFAEAEGEEAEADMIAAEVATALDEGSSPHEIAVVFRDPEPSAVELSAAFARLGVAADVDVLVPFSSTAFGRAFLQALSFVNTGDATALLGYGRSVFAALPSAVQEGFERAVRSRGMCGKQELLEELVRTDSDACRLIGVLEEALVSGLDDRMAVSIADAARELFGRAHSAALTPGGSALEEDARALGALISTIEDAVVLTDRSVTTRTLEGALRERTVSPGSVEREGHVQVTSVERARARRFEVVILAGLHAGAFPRTGDDPFAQGGAAGSLLESHGMKAGGQLGVDYERLLLYQVVTRPRKRLILVRRRTDSDGVLVAPSVFWEELLDFYRPAREEAVPPEWIRRLDLMDCGLSQHAPTSVRRALRTASVCGRGDLDPRVALALKRSEARPPVIVDAQVRAELSSRTVFSVSEIEVYLACPLRWFYEQVVNPRQLDAESGARERGRLVHEMLRSVYVRVAAELDEGRVTVENLPRAQELALEEMSSVLAREAPARDFEEDQDRRELQGLVAGLIEADATQLPREFKPHLLEWEFGGVAGIDVGAFALRGRIDRVDSDGKHAVVIDYKTGEVPKRAQLLTRGKIQAQLYAEVVRRVEGLHPAGSVYWSLKDCKPRGLVDSTCLDAGTFTRTDCSDSAQVEAEIEEAMQLASTAVEGMRAGELTRRPLEGACDWCTATALCGRCSR